MLTEADFDLLARHTDAENGHRLDDTLATLTPDCTFEDVALGLTLTGHAGAAEYYRMWWDGLDVTVDVEAVLSVADQPIVVAETTWRGRHIGPFLGVDPTNRPVRPRRDHRPRRSRASLTRASVLGPSARPRSDAVTARRGSVPSVPNRSSTPRQTVAPAHTIPTLIPTEPAGAPPGPLRSRGQDQAAGIAIGRARWHNTSPNRSLVVRALSRKEIPPGCRCSLATPISADVSRTGIDGKLRRAKSASS